MGRDILMTEELADYVATSLGAEPEIFKELRAETSALGAISQMQIGWSQALFMQALAISISAKRYLEIGVFTGYSALAIADILPADGEITALDISEEWTAIARKYWEKAGVGDKIDLLLGDAKENLQSLTGHGLAGAYDLAFIDADKTSYAHYFAAVLPLLRTGGVILVDNVLWGGAVIDPDDKSEDTMAIRAFNQIVRDDRHVFTSMLPIGDGITLCVKL